MCGLVQDMATRWIKVIHAKRHEFSDNHYVHKIRTNLWNISKTCEGLNWNHERSTSRSSEANGIAERVVRRVKEGTTPVLVQSGFQES